MASIYQVEAPTVRQRRRKSARERREQKCRAIARAFQTVAIALDNVKRHRGGALREIGASWFQHILRPHASEVPFPDFSMERTYGNVVLQTGNGSDDAASLSSSDHNSIQDPELLLDEEGEESASQQEDQESEELVSRSSSNSEGAHGNVALSQVSGSEASDSDSEDAVNKAIVDDDPENQRLVRKIHLPDIPRPEEAVGSNNVSCCEFSVGDLVRPLHCLANLKAYKYGAIGQVVGIDDGSIRFKDDIILSFFDDKGGLMNERIMHFPEHYEKICTIAIFEEKPYIPRSTMLERNGTILLICAKYCSDSRPSAASV